MSERVRLDAALVSRGVASSRSQAALAVREGRVRVDGRTERRPAAAVAQGTVLEVASAGRVGRGGGQLAAALDAFTGLEVAGRDCLDVGASTGGFTQVLLERGAAHVVALDVGHDQLAPQLRADPRVTVVEGRNARDLTAGRLADDAPGHAVPSLAVMDLSFISLTLVLPAIARTAPRADVVCLVKPQFEVGRTRIGGGVVRSEQARAAAIDGVLDAARRLGYAVAGTLDSPVVGEHGNREALAWLRPGARS